MDDHRAARGGVAFRPIGNRRLPHFLPSPRVERDEARIVGREQHLVLVDRDVAHRAHPDLRVRPDVVLPDQLAGARVERLQDVRGVDQIDDAVVHERHRFARAAAFVHRPHPHELQILDVVAGDLRQRAVAPALVVAPRHQPVAGIRIAQHLVGHRYVVLHLAFGGDPDDGVGAAAATASAPAASDVIVDGAASTRLP